MSPSNIVRLKIKNFMGISNVEIQPNQITQIVGENDNSKTTIIKALEAAFKGSTNGSLVKNGEDKAEIYVELPDSTTINRTIKPTAGQTVVVKDELDRKKNSPQTYLDGLFDTSAFNPLEVLDPKRRTEAILKAIDLKVGPDTIANRIGVPLDTIPKLDYKKHGLLVVDEAYSYYDKRRTEANRDALTKENKFKAYDSEFKPIIPPTITKDEISNAKEGLNSQATELKISLASIEQAEADNVKIQATMKNAGDEIDKIENDHVEYIKSTVEKIERMKVEIANLEEQMFVRGKDAVNNKESLRRRYQESSELLKVVPDKSGIVENLQILRTEYEKLNTTEKELQLYDQNQQQYKIIKGFELDWKHAQDYADQVTSWARLLKEGFKKELLATVDMPVEGLEIVDDKILVNGIHIDNLNTASLCKLAIGIARKLAKETKIICLDGAERLHGEVYTNFLNEIKDDGYTYFIVRVGEAAAGISINNNE